MSSQEMYEIPDFLKEKMIFRSNMFGGCRNGDCSHPPMRPKPCQDGECRPDRPPMRPNPCHGRDCGRPLMRAYSEDENVSRPPCPQYVYHPYLMGDLCSTRSSDSPTPFYQAYPNTLQMQQATDEERDLERLKDMYPEKAKKIQMLVDEQVDRLDYEGSMMFDSAPDKEQMNKVVDEIFRKFMKDMESAAKEETDLFEGECEGENCHFTVNQDVLRDLILVLLYQEMYRRRCLRRRCKRWW